MSEAKETDFKGMPLLALYRDPDDRYPFQFGVRKSRLILDHIKEIETFHEKHNGAKEG